MTFAFIFAALVECVDPFVGTAGVGHCSPAAACPFGMVQPGGDTGNRGWDYCAGYKWSDRHIVGFSQTHLNGTGSALLGDACVFPLAEKRALKSDEKASPGYYAVTLDGRVRAEATCTERVAFYRFTYAKGESPYLRVDPSYTISGGTNDPETVMLSCETNWTSATRLVGSVRTGGWIERTYHFVLEKKIVDNVQLVKIALSAKSVGGAERNLAAELSGWDFDGTRKNAAAKWERMLERIPFPAANPGVDRKMFYTSVYRLCLQPNLVSDADEAPFYSTFSLWDTFRAAHPLYREYFPEYEAAFVKSLLEQGRRTGHLPVWPIWGKEANWMIGTHSIPVVVDWFLRESGAPGTSPPAASVNKFSAKVDVPGVPQWKVAYAQIKDTLTHRHGRAKVNWEWLDRYGYYPCDLQKGESVSRLLEDSFDCWCAAKMAERLGRADDMAFFNRRANAWRNVLDRSTGFMRGRTTKGGWREPFDPHAVGHNVDTDNDFTEGNAYQWTWHVLQDPEGLIEALGGKAAAEKRLDELFAADARLTGDGCKDDITGMIGQYVHGNEPSHHIPWLYALCGRPDKARAVIERILREFYRPTPDGLAGNDDCGQMSAWYVWASLGRYPVTPCGGAFVNLPEREFGTMRSK